MFLDTHIHTRKFSADAVIDDADLIAYVNDNGPGLFCRTEHYDYDYPYKKHQLVCDLEEYHTSYQAAKIQFEGKMQTPYPVLFGIEYGYMENLGSYYNNLSRLHPFDNIICSVHYFDQRDPYFDRYIYASGKKAIYSRYLEAIVHFLENCDGFDIVGHFDYITRYAPYPDKKICYRDFPDLFDTIFSLCIKKGKALELNTRAPAQFKAANDPDYLFDPDILVRYKELGGQLISLGSDAHSPEAFLQLFDETKFMLEQAGFRYLVYYKQRLPHFLPI